MSQITAVQNAMKQLTDQYDPTQLLRSNEMGVSICPNFGSWLLNIDLEADGLQEELAVGALGAHERSRDEITIGRLLDYAALPAGWKDAYSWSLVEPTNLEFLSMLVDALYGEVSLRLFHNPPKSADEVLALAHLVEATIWLEGLYIDRAGASNYVPMGHVDEWWPTYMKLIDTHLSPEQLLQLSNTVGAPTETEALSSVTPPDRLRDIYSSSRSVVVANPRLPSDVVSSNMESDVHLLFHPNADRERAWQIIETDLANGDYWALMNALIEFTNMRDDGWFQFSGFATESPQAAWLRQRIIQWCTKNIQDDDERDVMLEELGLAPFE